MPATELGSSQLSVASPHRRAGSKRRQYAGLTPPSAWNCRRFVARLAQGWGGVGVGEGILSDINSGFRKPVRKKDRTCGEPVVYLGRLSLHGRLILNTNCRCASLLQPLPCCLPFSPTVNHLDKLPPHPQRHPFRLSQMELLPFSARLLANLACHWCSNTILSTSLHLGPCRSQSRLRDWIFNLVARS